MVDLKKSLDAGKISLVAMIGIGLLVTVMGFVPFVNILGGILGILGFFVINPILLGYAGYNGSKKFGMDLTGAALTGGLVGLIASLILGVVNTMFAMLGIGVSAASYGMGTGEAGVAAAAGAITLVASLIAIVAGVAIHTVGGLVCGAIGSVVAGKK